MVAGAPAIYEQVLISRGAHAQGGVLKGIVPQDERRVSDLLDSVTKGSADALDENSGTAASSKEDQASSQAPSPPPIILGKDMADQLGAPVGSPVTVTSPQGELTPFGIVPKYKRFNVAGIFTSGFYDDDSNWAFIRLSDAQKLFHLSDVVSVLEFKVDDIYRAPEIAQKLEAEAGKGFMSSNWMEQNRALFRALRLERVVTFITIGLIVFVAALNILISLIMMVMESRDIAVLVSMGARKRQIRRIFIYQGLLIGVIGTVLGLIAGYAISWAGGHYHLLSLSPRFTRLTSSLCGAPLGRCAGGNCRHRDLIHRDLVPLVVAASVLLAEALRYE